MPGSSKQEGVTCDNCLSAKKSCYVLLDPRGMQLAQGRKECVPGIPVQVKGPCKTFNIYHLHPGDD